VAFSRGGLLLGLAVLALSASALASAACGGSGSADGPAGAGAAQANPQAEETSGQPPSAGTPSGEASGPEAPGAGEGAEGEATLPPAGGDVSGPAGEAALGEAESTLIAAAAEHIDALNAGDRRAFVSHYADDCADGAEAGGFAYGFARPLAEAGRISTDYERITFLNNDRARVKYVAPIQSDVWVFWQGAWRISTCPEPG